MGKLWTIKAGEASQDAVYLGTAANLTTIGADEIGVFVGTNVGANQLQQKGLVQQCREALREAGFPLPATGLARADVADGGGRSNVATTLTAGATTINEGQVTIAYGTAFPRALAGGATLLFDEAIEEIEKARDLANAGL